MRLNEDVYVLELSTLFGGQALPVNLCLVVDVVNGATLVDAGAPGQAEAIVAAMADAGVGMSGLRRIVLTHQDLDHVGSLAALARVTGARVLAHELKAPFIDGTQLPRFARPEVQVQEPELWPAVQSFRPTRAPAPAPSSTNPTAPSRRSAHDVLAAYDFSDLGTPNFIIC